MSSDWVDTTVGQFCPFSYGKSLPERDRRAGKTPVISSAGFIGTHSDAFVHSAGIVIGRKGTVGSVTFSQLPFWPIDTAFYIADEPKKRDIRFTYYLLQTLNLREMNSDSAVPGLNRENAHALAIRVPKNLQDQRKISDILSALDDKITLNRQINQTLEAMAQAIFKSWFVDFDPVKAKIAAIEAGQDPLRAAMSAISGKSDAELDAMPRPQYDELAATAALFPEELEESELGDVPKGWGVKALSDLASFQNGYAFKTKDWTDTGYPVVKIGNVKPRIIDLSGCSFVSHDTVVGLEKFSLQKGDLLVGMTGYVGETGLVPSLSVPAYLNQRVGRIFTPNGINDIGYPFCVVRDPAYKAYAESKSHGSAQANVSGKDLMSYPIIIPSTGVLEAFSSQSAKIINTLLSYHEESHVLTVLRDTLLPKLLSGELSVVNLEEAV